MLDGDSLKRKREEEAAAVIKWIRHRPQAACFNCGSTDHAIRDCKKPRNINRINKAKKSFSFKQERYHVDIEQRFAHLQPGETTDCLKSALGLRKGEIPFYFYRMRKLGYPPGWLEEAKVTDSGIALYVSDVSSFGFFYLYFKLPENI